MKVLIVKASMRVKKEAVPYVTKKNKNNNSYYERLQNYKEKDPTLYNAIMNWD